MRSNLLLLLAATGLATAQPLADKWSSALLRQAPEWYATEEARTIANAVVLHQSTEGGWPKSTDLAAPPAESAAVDVRRANSFDNEATTAPMQFLALVASSRGGEPYRSPVLKGIDYILRAQYPNGGWPQFFPLREGYYSRITFNDNAMIRILTLLHDVAAGKRPYQFVDAPRRVKAARAVDKGIEMILQSQVRVKGKPTAWCAQHDERTLEPAWARNFEPPSLSGSESVGILRFLMGIDRPSPAVIAAIEGGIEWLRSAELRGVRLERFTDALGRSDQRLVDEGQAAGLWARFYEIGSNRAIYTGRDKKSHYRLEQIEHERRNGYSYVGNWPASLLRKDYPEWQHRLHRLRKPSA